MFKSAWSGILAVLTIELAVGLTCATSAFAEKAVPPSPKYYVLDEAHVLGRHSLQALQSLLVEHDRITSEQVVIAILDNLGDEDLVDYTSKVFQRWKIGKKGKDNGALLALYWKDHKARIEVGYGLEPLLTDAKSKVVLNEFLLPELKAGNPDRALSLAALEILKILGSPLIENGKAQEILRNGGFRGNWRPAQSSGGGPWQIFIFLGLILGIIVFQWVTSAEAHYTSAGWYRPSPWKGRRSYGSGGVVGGFLGGWGGGGGGGWGGGGDGGGFSGGGGSSGGGGASGSW